MNNETFLIENSCLEQAQDICKLISNEDSRNRAIANAFAAVIAKNFFENTEIDITSGLYRNPLFLEKLEIADIYIKNNYLDVRIYFNENELCVPKSHFDNNMLPVAYMFIKIDEELTNGYVTGFILPENVDTSTEFNGYYKIKESELISYYDVETLITEKDDIETDNNFKLLMFDYIDGKLSDTTELYQGLISSKEAREQFYNLTKTQIVFNYISINTEEEDVVNKNITKEDIKADTLELDLETESSVDLELTDENNENVLENEAFVEESEEILTEEFITEDSTDEIITDNIETKISFELEDVDSSEEFELEMQDENNEDTLDLELQDDSDNDEMFIEAEDDDLTLEDDTDSLLLEDSEEYTIVNEDINDIEEADNFEELEIKLEGDTDNELEVKLSTDDSNDDVSLSGAFDYSTTTTPSIGSFEDTSTEDEVTTESNEEDNETIEVIDELLENKVDTNIESSEEEEEEHSIDGVETLEFDTDEVQDNSNEVISEIEEISDLTDDKNAELEALFNDETDSEEISSEIDTYDNANDSEEEQQIEITKAKNNGKLVPLLGTLIIVSALGYWGYNKYSAQNLETSYTPATNKVVAPVVDKNIPAPVAPQKSTKEAMPVETVENTKKINTNNEGNAINIPAIEQNLDASILISNLSVEWEVPIAYTTNSTAKRYLTKMGKIIQLNLKSELLLLNNPPLTNKIIVELAYNPSLGKFEAKGFVKSSGEKEVDAVINRTIKNALDINLNMNMNSFGNIAGNPALVIRL